MGLILQGGSLTIILSIIFEQLFDILFQIIQC